MYTFMALHVSVSMPAWLAAQIPYRCFMWIFWMFVSQYAWSSSFVRASWGFSECRRRDVYRCHSTAARPQVGGVYDALNVCVMRFPGIEESYNLVLFRKAFSGMCTSDALCWLCDLHLWGAADFGKSSLLEEPVFPKLLGKCSTWC